MHPMGPGQKYCRVKGAIWDAGSVYSVIVLFSVREQATSQLQSNSTRLSSVLYHIGLSTGYDAVEGAKGSLLQFSLTLVHNGVKSQ